MVLIVIVLISWFLCSMFLKKNPESRAKVSVRTNWSFLNWQQIFVTILFTTKNNLNKSNSENKIILENFDHYFPHIILVATTFTNSDDNQSFSVRIHDNCGKHNSYGRLAVQKRPIKFHLRTTNLHFDTVMPKMRREPIGFLSGTHLFVCCS